MPAKTRKQAPPSPPTGAKRVLLNNIDHKDLRVIAGHSATFGDSVNQVLVFPTEYEELAREYPIFFRKGPDAAFYSVVVLGLDRDENLFLDAQGWQARYVPAMQQRGPFVIGLQEQHIDGEVRREPTIQIEVDHPRLSTTDGQPLFLPHGGNTPYLEHILGVMRAILIGTEKSPQMFAVFEELGLLREVNLEVKLDETRTYTLPGLFTIDEARLAALGGNELEALHCAGFLRAAFLAATSLGNVARLIELKNRKTAAS